MGHTFSGYRRPDGRVSVRNHGAVIPTSVAATVSPEAADGRRTESEHRRFEESAIDAIQPGELEAGAGA